MAPVDQLVPLPFSVVVYIHGILQGKEHLMGVIVGEAEARSGALILVVGPEPYPSGRRSHGRWAPCRSAGSSAGTGRRAQTGEGIRKASQEA